MTGLVYAIFIFVCFFLVIVVLLQPGKSGGLGAAFGGSSQTVFGASGATSMLQRVTVIVATLFMGMSLLLAYWSVNDSVTSTSVEQTTNNKKKRGLDFGSTTAADTAATTSQTNTTTADSPTTAIPDAVQPTSQQPTP